MDQVRAMTIIQAILDVMRDAGHSLTPKDAYRRIIEKGLYEFKAQSPVSVVTGQIRRHCDGLEFPSAEPTKYFRLESDGRFAALPEPIRMGSPRRRSQNSPQPSNAKHSSPRSLKSAFSEIQSLQRTYRELLKERILRDLKKLTPSAFERFARGLIEVYGFSDVCVTRQCNDGGIDGFGRLKVGLAHMKVAFQCKRWKTSNVGRPEIDRFRGAIQGEYEQGLFFTTAMFVSGAMQASIKPGAVPIILVDGPSIIDLMIQKHYGVQAEVLTLHTYALDTILSDGDMSLE